MLDVAVVGATASPVNDQGGVESAQDYVEATEVLGVADVEFGLLVKLCVGTVCAVALNLPDTSEPRLALTLFKGLDKVVWMRAVDREVGDIVVSLLVDLLDALLQRLA